MPRDREAAELTAKPLLIDAVKNSARYRPLPFCHTTTLVHARGVILSHP